MSSSSYCPKPEAIPQQWKIVKINDVAEVNPSGKSLIAEDDEDVTFLPMPAVQELSGKIDHSSIKAFKDVKKGYTRFIENDVLFAKITPCMENGKIAVARNLVNKKGCGSTEFHVLRGYLGVSPDYIQYYLLQDAYRSEAKRHMSGAVGQLRVPPDFLRESEIPLCSAGEQVRIVAKIEELFSDLDKGEESLRQAQAQLKRYRQSVLKAAVTGELTRDWREQNKDRLETGEVLLKRILKARREAWEKAELEKMRAKGVKPKDDSWKKKYVEPKGPDTSGLPELPEGWAWASLDQLLSEPLKTGLSIKGSTLPPGVKSLKLNAISSNEIDFGKFKYLPLDPEDVADIQVKEGDFFISRGNGSVDLVGRGGMARGVNDFYVFPDIMIRLRFVQIDKLGHFIKCIWGSRFIRNKIEAMAKTTAGIHKISQSQVMQMAIPLPSNEEMAIISRRTEESQNVEKLLLSDLCDINKLHSRLRQSILKSAFSGTLVPQNPNDEPASELLKRIAAGKPGSKSTLPTARRVSPRQNKREAQAHSTQAEILTASPKLTASGLAQLRKAAGMSQVELAKATGLNQAYISQMETGKRAISNEIAQAMSKALEVDLTSFAV